MVKAKRGQAAFDRRSGGLARALIVGVGVLVTALGLGSLAPATAYAASESESGSISGTVSLPADAPAEWWNAVSVYASPVNAPGAGGSFTIDRETGQYTISGLAAGDYRVQFSAYSYWDSAAGHSVPVNLVSEYYDNTVDWSSATLVTTGPGAPASGIDAALEYGSTISGTVSLPVDAPAEWMKAVSAYASPVNGSGSGGSLAIDPETGQYTISGLAAGEYRVQFSAYSYWDSATGESVPVNLVSEYYDDAVDWSSATLVTTGPGAPASGIDAALEYGGTISGTVSLPADAPAEWWNAVNVYASAVDGSGSSGPSNLDRETGHYTIMGLAAGEYRVQFSASSYWDSAAGKSVEVNLISEYYDNALDYSSANLVTTGPGAPASGIDAALEYGGTISGTLRDVDGAPVEGVGVWVIDAVDTSRGFNWGASSDASGAYSLTRLPAGVYKVFIGDLGGEPPMFQRTFLGGPTFASATPVTVGYGATVAGRDAVLEAVELDAPRPPAPVLSAGTRAGSYATVTWPTPASVDTIVGYGISTMGGWWGDGGPLVAPQSNSTQAWVGEESALVLVSAYTGSADGSAGAVVVNDPESPAAPGLRVATTSTTLTVSAESSAPADAEWWFAILPEGAGAGGLIVEYPDELAGDSFTFENVDPIPGTRVFAAWRGSDTAMSQIATLTLSAPVTPPAGPTVHPWFQAKYAELGGASGSLGVPVKAMVCQSSSCWQEFAGGVLTSDGRQIVKLSTAYVTTWLDNGGPDGALGLVAGPEACFGTYCVAPFTHGVIRWTPNVGVTATVVHAWFEAAWKAQGGVTGAIGSPVAAMQCQSSSCWQEFTGGVLTSDGRNIVKLSTAYVKTWLDWGGPNGDLGLVAGPETCHGTYCQTGFSGGVIVWVPNVGVFPVAKNWFYPAWMARGGATGSLGLPTDAMHCQSSACYQVFQNGTLTSSTSSIVALSSAYVSTWLANGGPDGALGLVAGSEACFGTYCQVPFQHGLLVWHPASGVSVHAGNPGDTKNCTDFATEAEAQSWFDAYYPDWGDIAKLDGNNDRIACESLP